ncbi:hypothetical protein LTR95_014943 [Oleoguttula sp. CCFEE 5521]
MVNYEATVQEFLKRLSVLIHISGGQPVRESEIFSTTYRNTQRRRSIIITFDRVMQQTGNYKENVRFLANPIAELLLDYIIYVLPLRQTFLRQASPKALLSPYIWEKDGKRQIIVAIVKTKFAGQIECFDPDEGDEDAEEIDLIVRSLAVQRNHKTRTVNWAYAN